jgi:hypothetical protein
MRLVFHSCLDLNLNFIWLMIESYLCVTGDVGSVYFGPNHPMKPHRLCMTHHLVLSYDLHKKMEIYVSYSEALYFIFRFIGFLFFFFFFLISKRFLLKENFKCIKHALKENYKRESELSKANETKNSPTE